MSPSTIHWHAQVGSTQDEAHRLAASGAPHGTVVAAVAQSEGRGTRGRGWVSGEGGLWLSVVCRPARLAAVEVAGVRVGLAVAAALERFLPAGRSLRLKWPNDLIADDGKLGGILAEARWQGDALLWMVVGVGVNVANELPDGVEPPARRLADLGSTATPRELAPPVAEAVAGATRECPPLSSGERAEFARREWPSIPGHSALPRPAAPR